MVRRAREFGDRVDMGQIENRASPRVALEVKVDLDGENVSYAGLTENISAGGLFLATDHLRRRVGEGVTLVFTLPGLGRPTTVSTEVRWIRESSPERPQSPAGMGLKFINLSLEASAAIREFLAEREPLDRDHED